MFSLTNIFEFIRHRKHYTKINLAEHLNVTASGLQYMLVNESVPDRHLANWARFLDFTDRDLPSISQYNNRYTAFKKFCTAFPLVPAPMAELLASIAYFSEVIDEVPASILPEDIRELTWRLTLPHIVSDSHDFREALLSMRDVRK